MNREYFLRELEELLSDMDEEERGEVLRYYRDLFAEAGPEGEAEILRRLGDPMKVAAEIREGLSGGSETGEFTESGYRDERFDDDCLVPERYVRAGAENGSADDRAHREERRRNGLLLLVLFLVFGFPAAATVLSAGFSVLAGLAGCALGILIGLPCLVFGGFVAALAFLVSGILCVGAGIFNLTAPAKGLMLMCIGFLMLSASMLLIAAAKWGCTTAVPGVFRFFADLLRSVGGWIRRVLRRVSGKGGAAV